MLVEQSHQVHLRVVLCILAYFKVCMREVFAFVLHKITSGTCWSDAVHTEMKDVYQSRSEGFSHFFL